MGIKVETLILISNIRQTYMFERETQVIRDYFKLTDINFR